jgi:hypothetical protein
MPIRKGVLFLLCTGICISKAWSQKQVESASMSKVNLYFSLDDKGIPAYSVLFSGEPVIKSSRLGFILKDGIALDRNFQVLKTDSITVDETWKPVWGEINKIRNYYKQITFHLQQKSSAHLQLNIVFKVFEDGIGFRYEFPVQPNLTNFIVSDEVTQFNLTGNHKAFWIPGDFDSNEYPYTTSAISEVDAWKLPMLSFGKREDNIPDQYAVQTPLMLKTMDGLYMNTHEAALVNYPSMQLHVNRQTYSLSANLVPDALGNKSYLRAPANTPWRTIIVSDKATNILASKMILNLNQSSKIKNTLWIKPMKFMGV